MKHFSMIFFSFICFLLASCVSQEEGSVFTSVNTDKCRSVSMEEAEQSEIVDKEEQEEIVKEVVAVFECKGVKAYRFYIVDDGIRSWYVLKHIKTGITSFEQDIVYKQNTLGDFPNIGGPDKVEWLLNTKGLPSGLVFRVYSQINDKETGRFKTIARYFAIKLDHTPPIVAGVSKTQKAVKELLKAF